MNSKKKKKIHKQETIIIKAPVKANPSEFSRKPEIHLDTENEEIRRRKKKTDQTKHELGDLEAGLEAALDALEVGGRLVVISFHSLDHLDNPRRAGGLTAFVQGIGYLIAGLSPLIAGMIRDQLGSFEWAWWSLTAVVVVMLLIVLRFDPRHYARHIR